MVHSASMLRCATILVTLNGHASSTYMTMGVRHLIVTGIIHSFLIKVAGNFTWYMLVCSEHQSHALAWH